MGDYHTALHSDGVRLVQSHVAAGGVVDPARGGGVVRGSFCGKVTPGFSSVYGSSQVFQLQGRTVSGKGVFAMYRTNGRQIRVIMARPFEPEESFFYERKVSQALG